MALPKISMSWLNSNTAVARRMLSGAFKGPTGASYRRWMVAGAGLGAVRGLADNIVGEDRISVMGGMMQGAVMGAAFRGLRSGMTGDLFASAKGLGRYSYSPRSEYFSQRIAMRRAMRGRYGMGAMGAGIQ